MEGLTHEQKALMFTCVASGDGADGVVPRPVHLLCWEEHQDYQRIKGAARFWIRGKWYESLPSGTVCLICRKVV